MTEIETITGETVDVGLIQSFIQELPEKAASTWRTSGKSC